MTWYYEGIEGSKAGQIGATMMGGGFLGDAAAPRHIWKHYGADGEPDMMAWAYVRDFPDNWAAPDEPPRSSKIKTKKIRSTGGGSSDSGDGGRRQRDRSDRRVSDVVTSGPAGGSFLGEGIVKWAIGILIIVAIFVWGFFQNPFGYLAELDKANSEYDDAVKAQTEASGSQTASSSNSSAAQSATTSSQSASASAAAATTSGGSSVKVSQAQLEEALSSPSFQKINVRNTGDYVDDQPATIKSITPVSENDSSSSYVVKCDVVLANDYFEETYKGLQIKFSKQGDSYSDGTTLLEDSRTVEAIRGIERDVNHDITDPSAFTFDRASQSCTALAHTSQGDYTYKYEFDGLEWNFAGLA